jgi:predicted unusual protein kinase regulating ubiquinone biosynthesis (AarF/ABC1/UbiB family)
MQIIKPETRRLLQVVIRFAPVVIRYRRDRREIKDAEGKIPHPEKYRKHAVKAVNAFVDLGPAFIKLGQLLSVRPDILPQPYIEEFAKLQDEVPPAPFSSVKDMIEKEIGGRIEEVFDDFDSNAVTGASLGQVYRARYKGREVVVKVNRPGIHERVSIDTKVLQRLVPLVGRLIDPSLRFSAQSVVDQFSETVQEEMNYKLEARNLLTIKKNLRAERDVVVPDVFPEISSEKVLVLAFEPGIKVSDVSSLDKAGLDRKKIARRVAKLFFRMLLSQDVFHADPHPGNIAITPEGKIVLYDYGMVGRLDQETRTRLVRFYTALADYDSTRIIDIMLELGVLQPFANRYVIKRGVELAFADMQGRKVEETEVRALMEIANRTIYQFPFKLPKNLVLYMRMLSILEGVCLRLDPNFRFVKILGGLLEEEGLVREATVEELKQEWNKITQAINASIEIAPMLKSFLENQGAGSGFLYPNGGGGGERRKGKRGTGRGFIIGVLGGFGVSGAAISIYFFNSGFARIGLVISLVLLIAAAVGSRF